LKKFFFINYRVEMDYSRRKVEEFQKYLESKVLTTVPIYPLPSVESIETKSRKPIRSTNQNGQELVLHAQPSEGNIENILNAFDGRKQVQHPSRWPNSVHGVVVVEFEGIEGKCFGTGTLIGPHIVLTAGHNLYDRRRNVYARLESIQFLPGIDVQMLPFGIAEVEQYFVSPKYVNENKEDYGILILKEPVGEETGYFGLVCPKPEELRGKVINVTGYPRDKVKSKPSTYEMWEMEGPAAYVDRQRGLMQYPIDTAGGQSGSGVWYREGEDYYVCGIHQGGNLTFNQATLLTKGIYEQIHTWLQQIPKQDLLQHYNTRKITLSFPPEHVGCLSLLATYNLKSLEYLDLSQKYIDAEGAAALAQNTSWTNLLVLFLCINDLGANGAAALAQNTSWTRLSQLHLSHNIIGGEGATALAQNTSWTNLSYLNLSCNRIDADGAVALAQNTSWTNLRHLDLSQNNLRASGTAALAQNTSWINLSRLNLSDNLLGPNGVAGLTQNTSWINLSSLDLSCNRLGADEIAVVAQNPNWSSLSITKIVI